MATVEEVRQQLVDLIDQLTKAAAEKAPSEYQNTRQEASAHLSMAKTATETLKTLGELPSGWLGR